MKKIVFSVAIALFACALHAQTIERYVIGSAGGSWNNGSNFYVDYTVGEVAITTIGTTTILTQGFQQPDDMTVSIREYTENASQVIVYPNPVVDQLNISIQNAQTGTYRVKVYDLLGQLLIDQSAAAGFDGTARFTFGFENFATGNYFVRIMHDQKLVQIGKIIKINQ